MKLKKNYIFSILCFVVLGCATPNSVKKLSTEIVDVNEKYLQSLTDYFTIIEKFVDGQIKVSEFLIKESDEKIENLAINKAKLKFKKENPDVDAILNDLVNELSDNSSKSLGGLSKLTDLSSQLKLKHKELLDIQKNIITAQRKLDEYIQLEKADDILVNEFLGIVGIQKEKLVNTIDDISNIYTEIEEITKK